MVIATEHMLLRLGTSIALGTIVGLEREQAGRAAGLRTHLLVTLASATFMLVSTQFLFFQSYGRDDLVTVDTSRIATSVVAGVGFLGAGAILRTGLGIQGLTTAASLWMMASIGLAAGSGMYVLAASATAGALVCLIYLRRWEGKQSRLMLREVVVVLDDDPSHLRRILDGFAACGAAISDVEHDRNLKANTTRLTVEVRVPTREELDKLLATLGESPGVQRIKVQRPE